MLDWGGECAQLILGLTFVKLINFHGSINFDKEDIRCVESNRGGKEPERKNHDPRVSKVKQTWDEFSNFQTCLKIKDGVDENINCRASRGEECFPPPVIVLE